MQILHEEINISGDPSNSRGTVIQMFQSQKKTKHIADHSAFQQTAFADFHVWDGWKSNNWREQTDDSNNCVITEGNLYLPFSFLRLTPEEDGRAPWLSVGRQASLQKTTEVEQVAILPLEVQRLIFSFKLDAFIIVICFML